jgi:glycosyltransferase involved in cell wall biosynthesis
LVDVVITRCNPVVYDIRVFKMAGSLKKRYSVLALGWNRERVPREITSNYIVELKLCSLNAPYGKSLIHSPKMVAYYVYFWIWLFIQLAKARPKVIHACDLDTVIPCYFYKLIFRNKLIFDVFDRYAIAFVPKKYKIFYSIVNFIEEFFSKKSNVLITISEKVLSTFHQRPKQCVIIFNCPEDYAIDKKNSREDGVLKIVYTGGIRSKTRGLESITSAIKDLPNVELVIAGWYIKSDKQFLKQIRQIPNVKYMGILKPNDALILEACSDVMVALYDPTIQWHNITLPNKFFEAMMCGVPLITNVSPEFVNSIGFGIIVQYDNIKQIRNAVVGLRDNRELRTNLGLNGRRAYLEKYNWMKMEEEIFQVYSSLVAGSQGTGLHTNSNKNDNLF